MLNLRPSTQESNTYSLTTIALKLYTNLYAKNVHEKWYGVKVLIFLVIKKMEYCIYTSSDHRQTFIYISYISLPESSWMEGMR
jgi:hypothetical protein